MSSKKTKGLSRRRFINAAAAGGVGLAGVAVLAGCGETQVVEVVKEVPVETVKEVVKEVPVVEERVVTKEVQKVVEKIVTVEAMPAKPQALTLVFATWWALERGGFGR